MTANILDTIIANQTTGATITRQNNGTNSINWVRGLSDPGEMIGCGMYQELRRLDGETDAAYQPRLESLLLTMPAAVREKITTAMKSAALKRAALDNSTGEIALIYTGDAWHELGTQVSKAMNRSEVIALCPALGFHVEKIAATWTDKTGKIHISEDTYIIYRTDTGAQLGSAGSKYKPVQIADGFDVLDNVMEEFGARYHTAGALYNGRQVWMQAELPQYAFELPGNDRNDLFATIFLDHSGAGAGRAFATEKRAVCKNTLRLARADEKTKGSTIRHTGNVKEKLADVRRAFGLAVMEAEEFKELAEAAYRAPMDCAGMANAILDEVLEITEAQSRIIRAGDTETLLSEIVKKDADARAKEIKRYERAERKRASILDDILTRSANGSSGPEGTAWNGLNAITGSTNHAKWGKEQTEDRESRQLESLLIGDKDKVNQLAVQYIQQQLTA